MSDYIRDYDRDSHRYREITVVAKVRVRRINELREHYRVLNRALAEAVDTHGGEQLIDFFAEPSQRSDQSIEQILEVTRHQLKHGVGSTTEIIEPKAPGDEYPRTETDNTKGS